MADRHPQDYSPHAKQELEKKSAHAVSRNLIGTDMGLLVEDGDAIIEVGGTILESCRCEVLAAHS